MIGISVTLLDSPINWGKAITLTEGDHPSLPLLLTPNRQLRCYRQSTPWLRPATRSFWLLIPFGSRLSQFLSKCLDPHYIRSVGSKHGGTEVYSAVRIYPSFTFLSHPFSGTHETVLIQDVQSLLQLGSIEEVSPHHQGKGFYSYFGWENKPREGLRPILDLWKLNKYIFKKFHMVTVACIILYVDYDCFVVLDLKDACFHVIHHSVVTVDSYS